jgi:hypothetical protein
MYMAREVPLVDGIQNVFPNYRHQGRKDGWGMKSLSPKSIGPIKHGQPGLPDAKNLENFHQGSKWFKGFTYEEFKEAQLDMFNDPEPHRHHRHAHKLDNGKRNTPHGFVWIDKSGKEHGVKYQNCRQFYCHFYERAVLKDNNFLQLVDAIERGVNLNIVGYDGYNQTNGIDIHYYDASRPFGHEMVLYTMLKYPESVWPWRSHKTFDY